MRLTVGAGQLGDDVAIESVSVVLSLLTVSDELGVELATGSKLGL